MSEMRYLWHTGDRSKRRVMHIAEYDRAGNMTGSSLCGRSPKAGFDRSINAPFALGRRICTLCRRALP